MYLFVTKKYKNYLKHGLYLDLITKLISNFVVNNIFIYIFQFLLEKYLVEYTFKYSYLILAYQKNFKNLEFSKLFGIMFLVIIFIIL